MSAEEISSLKADVEALKAEDESLKTKASSRADCVEEFKACLPLVWKLKNLLADGAFPYFQLGFEKCKDQFLEAGLMPSDREEFPSFEKTIASIPAEEEKTAEFPA